MGVKIDSIPSEDLSILSNYAIIQNRLAKKESKMIHPHEFCARFEKYVVEKLCSIKNLRKYAKRGLKRHTFRVKVYAFDQIYWDALRNHANTTIFQRLSRENGLGVSFDFYQTGITSYDCDRGRPVYNEGRRCSYDMTAEHAERAGMYFSLGLLCFAGIGIVLLPIYAAYTEISDSKRAFVNITVSWP